MRFREPQKKTAKNETQPINPPPLPSTIEREGWVTQVREYELITPLFGGGVEAGVVDTEAPISGKGIRGQLRFWWRATRGGYFKGSLQRMRKIEERVWGTASLSDRKIPPPVQLSVELLDAGRDFEVQRYDKRQRRHIAAPVHDLNTPYGYVAFPLREVGEQAAVRAGIRFRLHLAYPENVERDVNAALWAWERFGGVGARTRRGFGAIHCVAENGEQKTPPSCDFESLRDYLGAGFAKYVRRKEWPENVPHLSQRIVVANVRSDPLAAWEHLIQTLRDFRQWREERYGVTSWPEPNAIREREGKAPLDGAPKMDKFPRAAFGLPILFEFPQERALPKVTLTGNSVVRLASPVVLRPLRCGNGKGVGIALILETERGKERNLVPGGLKLDGANSRPPIEHGLDEEDSAQINPLQRNETDVLEAFMNYLSENP